MNTNHHRTIYNQARGCLMAVAETAKSSGKASGESRSNTTQTRRKARFTWSLRSLGVAVALNLQATLLLPFGQTWAASQSQQGLQAGENYAASQLGTDPARPLLAFGGMPLAVGVSPQLMEWMPPPLRHQMCQSGGAKATTRQST